MSALESISEWVEDNYTAECSDTPFTFFDQIDNDFRSDFRVGLEKILKNDIDAFFDFLEDKIERDCDESKEDKDTERLDPRLEERIEELEKDIAKREKEIEEEKTDIEEPKGIIYKILGFLLEYF